MVIDEERLEPQLFCIQNPDEKVLKVLRRGLILELPWMILTTGIVLFILQIGKFLPISNLNAELRDFIDFLRVISIVFIAAFSLNKFLNWLYSVNIITNQRILDFEFSEIGVKSITECQIKHIQSVSIQNEGLLSFLFGLATVKILTSGDNPNIDFEFISNSNEIQDLISDLARGKVSS